jgi:hypothetical protein
MSPEEQRQTEARLDYENLTADAADRLRLQGEMAQAIFRGLTLVNGGAIIALFTFIGNSESEFDATKIWWAFGCFVSGLALTLVALMAAFRSQSCYMKSSQYEASDNQRVWLNLPPRNASSPNHRTEYRLGEIAEYVAMGAVGSAFMAFVIGSGFALTGVL